MTPGARVLLVEPAATLPLRQRVLRPHQSVAEMAAETDVEGAVAAAARLGDAIVSCAVAMPAPCPELAARAGSWRVRGMATETGYRGDGLGSAVLDHLLAELGRRGGRLVWCNARTPALALYRRAGFITLGDPWEEPMIGPHQRMWREL